MDETHAAGVCKTFPSGEFIIQKPSNFTVEIMTLLTTFDSPVYHMHC